MITPVALFVSALSSALNTEAHFRKEDVIMPVASETTLRIKFVDDNVDSMVVVYENVVEHESVTLNLFITNTARYTLDHIKRLADSVHYAAAYIDDLGILRIDRYGDPVLTSINADNLTEEQCVDLTLRGIMPINLDARSDKMTACVHALMSISTNADITKALISAREGK